MKALQFARFGEPVEVVSPVDLDVPQPGTGEVRLRLLRSPIHNHDLATIRGTYGVKPALPAIGGSEMLGVVDAVGSGVTALSPGQRVASMPRGAWSEFAIVQAEAALPVPDAVSDDAGCQLLAMPLSTVVLFDSLRVSRGDWIVQNAANGAVGTILASLAREAGVNVVNVVRRRAAAEQLAAHGAAHVVATEDEGWAERVRACAGDAKILRVVDSVCDANSMVLNRMLAPSGEHVVFGALAGRALTLDPGALIFGQTVVRGFWMYAWMLSASDEARLHAIGRVFELATAGKLPLSAGGVFALGDAKTALAQAERPGRSGKILFKV